MADLRTRTSVAAGQVTTDTATDVSLIYDAASGANEVVFPNQCFTPLSFHVWNSGANNIDAKVLGSNTRDLADSFWVDQSLSLTAVGAGSAKTASIAQPGLAFYKVQVASSATSTPGTAHVTLAKMASE